MQLTFNNITMLFIILFICEYYFFSDIQCHSKELLLTLVLNYECCALYKEIKCKNFLKSILLISLMM